MGLFEGYLLCYNEACANITPFPAFIFFILIIFTAGLGTILGGLIDRKGVNSTAVLVGFETLKMKNNELELQIKVSQGEFQKDV